MASPLVSRVPQCFNCIRRTAGSLGERHLFPTGQQIRGKKSARTIKKVNVVLLKDVKGYGKQGAFLSLPPGVMRNTLYPRQQAVYATNALMAKLGIKEGDFSDLNAKSSRNFEAVVPGQKAVEEAEIVQGPKVTGKAGVKEAVPLKKQKVAEVEAPVAKLNAADPKKDVKPEQDSKPTKTSNPGEMTPQETTAILSSLLPASVNFYREPVTPVGPLARKKSSSVAAKAVVSTTRGVKQSTSIVGSVSTIDIAMNLTAALAQVEEGKHIKLRASDIMLVKEPGKTDIEDLGTFEVDIKIEGSETAIRRTINVKEIRS